MRGGVIERVNQHSYWVNITKDSKEDDVNTYRDLEAHFLNEFAMNSPEINSNKALEGVGLILGNFRKENNLEKLEEWEKIVNEIIRLREKVNEEKKVSNETPEQKKIRENHEYRLSLWIPIYHGMLQWIEEIKLRIKREDEERDSELARHLEMKQLANAAREPDKVLPSLDTTAYAQEKIEKEKLVLFKQAKLREDEESKKIEDVRKREEILEEYKNKSKRDAIERQQKIEEDVIQKSIQEQKKHEEDNSAIKKAIQMSDIERLKLTQVEKKKYHLIELKEKLDNAPKEYKKLLDSLNYLEKMIDELEKLLATRNESAEVHKNEKAKINKLIKKENSVKNQQEVMRLNKMKVEIEKNDEKIVSYETQIRQGYKKITDSTDNTKKIQDTIKILEKPETNLCDNPPCFNHVNLRPCSGCRLVYYCSIECQKSDWKNHKQICVKKGGKTRSKKKKTMKKSRRYKNPLFF